MSDTLILVCNNIHDFIAITNADCDQETFKSSYPFTRGIYIFEHAAYVCVHIFA